MKLRPPKVLVKVIPVIQKLPELLTRRAAMTRMRNFGFLLALQQTMKNTTALTFTRTRRLRHSASKVLMRAVNKRKVAGPTRPGYVLTFQEEFDAPLNWTLWGHHRFDTSDLASHYIPDNSHGNYVNTGSSLILRAKYEPTGLPNGKVWSSGEIDTGGSFLQTYGYWEARFKVSGGQGVWPAFWMMPTPTLSPNNPAEIDSMESIGNPGNYIENYHWAYNTQATGTTVSPVTPDVFHTVGLQWDPGLLVWFIDDLEVKRYTSANVYAAPMYAILNLAIGAAGSWPGSWSVDTPNPVDFEIDWVHIWRRA